MRLFFPPLPFSVLGFLPHRSWGPAVPSLWAVLASGRAGRLMAAQSGRLAILVGINASTASAAKHML